ncbi:MAG: 2-C-methyl-D-erythritol 2,4-cyclodiphosphate synthase, partial [Clostridia bacterium]|nr:2-C-methyl-D-erythritol 2,4-cyclodiphosphate synthase [Clostridia bacterium]
YLIGEVIDYHKLIPKKNNYIILGGVKIPSNYQVVAQSDGDCVYHAISNAILGALQLGDIGDYFSDKNKKNKNLNSRVIIDYTLAQLKNKKLKNIDLTIICDKILLTNYKAKIRNNLIKITKCKNINVKATRFEENKNLIACKVALLVEGK